MDYLFIVDDGACEVIRTYPTDEKAIKGAYNRLRTANESIAICRMDEMIPFRTMRKRSAV